MPINKMPTFKVFAVCAFSLLGACSTPSSKTSTAGNSAAASKPTVSDESQGASLNQMIKSKATRAEFTENELSNLVSAFVAANPKAEYDDVAAFANKQLKETGFPFDLASLDAEPQGTETLVKTVNGELLNIGLFWEPLCGEGIAARYPVVGFKKEVWTVKYKSGTYEIRAKPLRVGEIIRAKDGKKMTTIPIPEEGFEPGGISTNGKALFARLPLNAATNMWWKQQMRRDPKDEPPFLVLLIADDKIEFSGREEDLDNYEDKPQRKTEEDDSYQITYPDSLYKFRSTVCT